METTSDRRVDHSALRVSQAFTISLLVLSFVLNSIPVVGFMAAVMLIGAAFPAASLFQLIYRHILKPVGLVKPDVLVDNPEPHRFSQGLGGTFVLLGFVALLLNLTLAGWALVWLVVFLASVNLFLDFCAGCFLYYQMNRLGLPGFQHSRIKRT